MIDGLKRGEKLRLMLVIELIRARSDLRADEIVEDATHLEDFAREASSPQQPSDTSTRESA